MARFTAILILVYMALIAASVGATLYLWAGFSLVEAALVATVVLAALAAYNIFSARIRDREDVSEQIADLSRGTADLARQVGEIGRRLATVEGRLANAAEAPRHVDNSLTVEIEELGGIVKQLADSVAAHESILAAGGMGAVSLSPALPVAAGESPGAPAPIDLAELDEVEPERATSGRFKGLTREEILAVLREAIEANRIDLYLQPIVSLPQRKVRYYEGLSRLRTPDGEILLPADFLTFAQKGNLMPRIDNILLFRCVQVVRRLVAKSREIGLFCNISGSTLVDSEYSPQFFEFMQANRALAPSLVLEFSQEMLRAMGPIEQESLAALAELGFRFSLDRLSDLRLEPRDLAERGFRFVKVPAHLLLNRTGHSAGDIDPADFSDLLGRFGIDLIAEKIESEGTVVDLLDHDVRFGQGFLFSQPRPVRADAFQKPADPADGASNSEAGRGEPGPPGRAGEGPPGSVGPSARGERRPGRAAELSHSGPRRV